MFCIVGRSRTSETAISVDMEMIPGLVAASGSTRRASGFVSIAATLEIL